MHKNGVRGDFEAKTGIQLEVACGKIYDMAVIELIRLLRIVKRQLLLLRGAPLTREEKEKLLKAIDAVESEFEVFRL